MVGGEIAKYLEPAGKIYSMKKYITHSGLVAYRNDRAERCLILGIDDYKPVVDHDHKTGRIRGVISSEANVMIGKIENFFRSRCAGCDIQLPHVLRRIAMYLESDQGPYHPVGVRQLVRRFARSPKENQIQILNEHYTNDEIESCKNSSDRAKLYRKTLVEE